MFQLLTDSVGINVCSALFRDVSAKSLKDVGFLVSSKMGLKCKNHESEIFKKLFKCNFAMGGFGKGKDDG